MHPSRYRQLIDGLDGIAWRDVHPITEQSVALRFVVLADRLYDKDLPIVSSGVPLTRCLLRRCWLVVTRRSISVRCLV